MKITMKEVAALAGVGVETVLRVINGVRVKDSTYQKVQAAIKELNYQPDEYARGLKINRSNGLLPQIDAADGLIYVTVWFLKKQLEFIV